MFTVVLDANVLYGQYLRSFLVYVALTKVAVFRWTDRILDECFEDLTRNREDLAPEVLAKTRQLMNAAIPDVLVTGYEVLESSLQLPDPNDRHVLAAAIRCGAQAIVTFNRKDFPEEVLIDLGASRRHRAVRGRSRAWCTCSLFGWRG
jgi:predicted nucleic acid-binding protein